MNHCEVHLMVTSRVMDPGWQFRMDVCQRFLPEILDLLSAHNDELLATEIQFGGMGSLPTAHLKTNVNKEHPPSLKLKNDHKFYVNKIHSPYLKLKIPQIFKK